MCVCAPSGRLCSIAWLCTVARVGSNAKDSSNLCVLQPPCVCHSLTTDPGSDVLAARRAAPAITALSLQRRQGCCCELAGRVHLAVAARHHGLTAELHFETAARCVWIPFPRGPLLKQGDVVQSLYRNGPFSSITETLVNICT